MKARFAEIAEIIEWLVAAEHDPEKYLPPRERTLWTRGELFELFRRYSPGTPLSVDAFGRGLREFGRNPVNLGEPIKTCDGAKRLFAMRNRDYLERTWATWRLTRIYNEERLRERTALFAADQNYFGFGSTVTPIVIPGSRVSTMQHRP